MKFLAKLTVCLLLAFAVYPTQASVFSITEQQVNDYLANKLAEKVPLQDKINVGGLFSLDYHLHDLVTKIGQTDEKRVAISGIVDGKLRLYGKKYDAQLQLDLDTIPYFDPEKGTVYLKEIRLLSWQAKPEKYTDELQLFLPMVAESLASYLNNNPIYTLDPNKDKEALVKHFGKAIVVEKGQIRLETSIF